MTTNIPSTINPDNLKITIIFNGIQNTNNIKNDPFLIIDKPAGLPSAPLKPDDEFSAISQAVSLFPELKDVNGLKKCEYGLLHRLDTDTRGLMVIATTQQSYDAISLSQKNGLFKKTYLACCDSIPTCSESLIGFPPVPKQVSDSFTVSSYFRPFGKGRESVRPVTDESGRAAHKKTGNSVLYSTEIILTSIQNNTVLTNIVINNNTHLYKCSIVLGYRHQVRCHLAWCGLPVKGDKLYNPLYKKEINQHPSEMMFYAVQLEFPHPITGRLVSFSLLQLDKKIQ